MDFYSKIEDQVTELKEQFSYPNDGTAFGHFILKGLKINNAKRQPKYIVLSDGFKILAYGLKHPSAGFSYSQEVPILKKIIDLA